MHSAKAIRVNNVFKTGFIDAVKKINSQFLLHTHFFESSCRFKALYTYHTPYYVK